MKYLLKSQACANVTHDVIFTIFSDYWLCKILYQEISALHLLYGRETFNNISYWIVQSVDLYTIFGKSKAMFLILCQVDVFLDSRKSLQFAIYYLKLPERLNLPFLVQMEFCKYVFGWKDNEIHIEIWRTFQSLSVA